MGDTSLMWQFVSSSGIDYKTATRDRTMAGAMDNSYTVWQGKSNWGYFVKMHVRTLKFEYCKRTKKQPIFASKI